MKPVIIRGLEKPTACMVTLLTRRIPITLQMVVETVALVTAIGNRGGDRTNGLVANWRARDRT